MAIILYDLYTNVPGHALSLNSWKARYALNYKGVPYKTEWLELPGIVAFYIDNGIPTALKKADGTPHYSVPLIYDESTKKYINDSFEIAVYLDKTYPTPPIFPRNTIALQSLVADACMAHVKSIFTLNMPGVLAQLNPASRTYYEAVIAAGNAFPREREPSSRDVLWEQFEEGLGKIDEWYKRTDGPFLMGDTISWADFVVSSYFTWVRIVWGAESQEWKRVSTLNGGHWEGLVNLLQKYAVVL